MNENRATEYLPRCYGVYSDISCGNCPYRRYEKEDRGCIYALHEDALALLKEQERVILPQEKTDLSVEELEQTGTKPRVLTSDELFELPRLSIVFIECWDGEYQAPLPTIFAGMKCYDGTIVDEDGSIFSDFEDDMTKDHFGGSCWRFWSAMPTEEQRKAVPWE